MTPTASVTRGVAASSVTVLRVAQLIRLADVLDSPEVPGWVRRLVHRRLSARLDDGLFAVLMTYGFSVAATEPMVSLSLGRPLSLRRRPEWMQRRPASQLLVRLAVRPDGPATDVTIGVGVAGAAQLRGIVVRGVLLAVNPLLRKGISIWMDSLQARIDALRSSRVSPAAASEDRS